MSQKKAGLYILQLHEEGAGIPGQTVEILKNWEIHTRKSTTYGLKVNATEFTEPLFLRVEVSDGYREDVAYLQFGKETQSVEKHSTPKKTLEAWIPNNHLAIIKQREHMRRIPMPYISKIKSLKLQASDGSKPITITATGNENIITIKQGKEVIDILEGGIDLDTNQDLAIQVVEHLSTIGIATSVQ